MEPVDDDFGELYADVVVHKTSATDGIPNFTRLYIETEEDDGRGTKSQEAKVKEEFISDTMKVDSECGESTRSGGEDSDPRSGKEMNDDYIGSDSEDDLNIVLNDEDCPGFAVGGVRNGGVVRPAAYDEDDGDELIVLTEGSSLGNNGKCGDQLADRSELVSSNGLGGQNKHGVKGGYSSQFFHHKYVRRGSAFRNNIKAMPVSFCSHLTKGGRNGNACVYNKISSPSHLAPVCTEANPMVAQCGYGSYLPWHWSIFDVNIDSLEEKPWRITGVDITDYFNFDFDENTWKHYCQSLEQLWQASVQHGIPINESSKINQEAMTEQIDQTVSGSLLSPSLGCEPLKGRAIQVEDSIGERQPSMDVRRPRSRDSDVIQIKVLESSDGYSGSGNSNVNDTSEEGEFNTGNNINILNSVSEHDDGQSEELLKDVKKSEDSYIEERKDQIPGVDKNEHQGQVEQQSEDTAETLKGEEKAEERVGLGTCTADLCLIESELSFGDQDLSLTSYTDSDSEATENSVHDNNEKKHSPLRRKSENSATDLKESEPSYHKISRNSSFNRKPVNIDYYSRNRGPNRQERRPQSCRHQSGSKLYKHIENYNDVSSNLMSGDRDLSLSDREFFSYGRQKERLQDFSSHKRRDASYYRETEQSCHYDGEMVVDDMVHTLYTKYSYREGRDSFRENTNRHVRRNWNERECIFENRPVMADNEDSDRDWYPAHRGCSADDLSPRSYRESRQLMSKHYSFPAKDRDIQRRRMHDEPHVRDRNCDNDQWLNECGLDLMDKSYRMSTSIEREMESLDNKHEQKFLHIDGELKRSARRGRLHERPPSGLNSFWSGKMDECQKYTRHSTSNLQYRKHSYPDSLENYFFDTRVNENLRGCGRHKHARVDIGSHWYCNNIDATEDQDCIIHPEKEFELGRRRYSSPSEVLHWTEDDVPLRHQDKFAAEEKTFSYEETSWHKRTYARCESVHDEMLVDDIQFPQHQLNIPRRDNDNFVKSSNIICRGKSGLAKLKCRNSIDLVKGEGKSHGRSSRPRSLMCSGSLGNLDQGITKRRTVSMGSGKSHMKKVTNSECDHNYRKCLQRIPDKGQKEGLDVEEGQIVSEEPHLVASISRRDVSQRGALTESVKKKMPNGNNSERDNNIEGYDSQRILETLAKMEKRRERFKEPITMKIEAERSMKLNDDLIVDTGEMLQHRPARKRRWGGS